MVNHADRVQISAAPSKLEFGHCARRKFAFVSNVNQEFRPTIKIRTASSACGIAVFRGVVHEDQCGFEFLAERVEVVEKRLNLLRLVDVTSEDRAQHVENQKIGLADGKVS